MRTSPENRGRARTIVALYRADHVSGINATARRMATMAEPWRPLICGAGLDPSARTLPGFGDMPVSIATWAEGADPVVQSLAVLEALRAMGATIVVPNDIPHGFVAAGLDESRGLRCAAWIHADGLDAEELVERCGGLASSWRGVSASNTGRAAAVGTLPARLSAEVVPCPVDVAERAPAPPAWARGEPIELVYAGRLERHSKRVMDLVALCDALVAVGVRFHLRIAGRGPAEAELVERMAPHVRAGRVTLLGPIAADRMADLYARVHALVLVSGSEGMPVVAMEAMAAGRAVIGTDRIGGAVGPIRAHACGTITPVGDMHAMARAIASLTPETIRAMGARAHAHALSCYSIRAIEPAIARWMDETEAAAISLDPSAPESITASIAGRWALILRAIEAIGPCPEAAIRALSTRFLGAIGRPQMAGGLATWLPNLPGARERHFTRAIEVILARGHRRVALYGAGAHTRGLARAIEARPEIVAIVDDRAHAPGVIGSLASRPVVLPSELDGMRVDAVLVSSDEHEQAMLRRALAWGETGVCGAVAFPLYHLRPTIGYSATRARLEEARLEGPVATLEPTPIQATRRAG